ncbi:MAG: hypothetical protein V4472_25595 [Pseudomonadota bacterium]
MCNALKDLSKFSLYRHKTGSHDRTCKECRAAQTRARTASWTPEQRRANNAHGEARRRQKTEQIIAYLAEHRCVDCGEDDPTVLEFDHVRGKKIRAIASMTVGYSWPMILAEIAKCEVRCANCHRRRTAVQLGYYNYFGRDHRGEARAEVRRLLEASSGQPTLSEDQQQAAPDEPLVPLRLLGLAEKMNEILAESPREFHVGDTVTILVAVIGEPTGLRVEEAAILDPSVQRIIEMRP